MQVLFSPSYSGFVYQDFSNPILYFNCLICNTEGLINLLGLHAGLQFKLDSDFDRVMDYSNAMKLAFKKNPSNLFAPSYEIDKFNTAKQCLKWRDSLRLAKWNPDKEIDTARLEALSEIESEFYSLSSGEMLLKITEAVKNGCNLPKDLEVITPFDYSLFHPSIRELLKALEDKDVSVHAYDYKNEGSTYLKSIADILTENKNNQISLKDSDDSFEILSFKEKGDALRYLSLLDDEYDVYINRDNKAFDSYLNFLNKPAGGAEDNGSTSISMLPLTGIKIFEKPFNILSLLNWLSTPINPIQYEVRNSLIDAITHFGGYFCEDCKKIIKEADEKTQEMIKKFLPDINNPTAVIAEDEKIEVGQLKEFVKNLSEWIKSCLRIKDLSADIKEQLESALETNLKIERILLELENKFISFPELYLAFESLSLQNKSKVSESQIGSKNIINASSMFAGFANKVLWCDFYNPNEEKLTYEFLSPKEKEIFGERLWKEEVEKKFNRYNKYLPFLYTKKKLTLLTVKKDGTKDVEMEPLIIRITQNMGKIKDSDGKEHDLIDDYLIHKSIADLGLPVISSALIDNRKQDENGIIEFDASVNKPQFRQNESFSALSNLIDNPFDYTFKYILELDQKGQSSLSPVFTTKGSVAHRIIEILFDPACGGKPKDIRQRINNDFDATFDKAVLEKGEILLLEKNKTERLIFKRAVCECVTNLCSFMEVNHLEVEACEDNYKNILIDDFKREGINIVLDGSIDMLLKDGNNNPVIFDFKYSPKMDKYKEWFEKGRAMQLSIYKAFVRQKKGLDENQRIRSAYVLLPEVKVISADNFEGNYIKVQGSSDNLLKKMANSYKFRKSQIEEGKLEDGEWIDSNRLDYVLNTTAKELIELSIEKHPKSEIKQTKEENKYSQYKFFKAGK